MEPGEQTQSLELDTALIRQLLVGFLRDETRNAGFTRGILGLSGGVDSAVVAFLAAEALGGENVLGVIMPYRSSNPQSRIDAERVASAAGIRTEVVEITPMVEAFHAAATGADQVRKGNVMARQRMVVLYDVSSRERGLVFGTSNKTEILLGYGTIFGDLACALNPLGDLYKTQVWQLAASLGVPDEVVRKKPSADLWEGQTDEGDLGMTYARADRLLYAMIDDRKTDPELEAMGFEPAFIGRVRTLVRLNQFKRRPPLIAKVSHRTVNVDFRYPRDWGV